MLFTRHASHRDISIFSHVSRKTIVLGPFCLIIVLLYDMASDCALGVLVGFFRCPIILVVATIVGVPLCAGLTTTESFAAGSGDAVRRNCRF